ncbi:MAG: hypothetical protein WHV44_10995, partial [Anaerolineales bacterium]
MNLQRVAILFVTLLALWLAACAAPPVASIQPMLIAAPPNDIRPSVTPLPTAQPPAQFIRPPGAP